MEKKDSSLHLPLALDSERLESTYKIAMSLSKSNLLPIALRGKPADILVILCMASELNIPPMQALNSIDVIQGKPAISPQLMIAMVKTKAPKAVIKYELDEENLMAKCTAAESLEHYKEEMFYTSTWTMKKAQMMGLSGRDNYKKQPLNMLKWRATGEALRVIFPHIIMGVYIKEELQDFDGNELNPSFGDVEQDFPLPEDAKVPGPTFMILGGKFRGMKLCEIDEPELEEYLELLKKRADKGSIKDWENEAITAIEFYLQNKDFLPVEEELDQEA